MFLGWTQVLLFYSSQVRIEESLTTKKLYFWYLIQRHLCGHYTSTTTERRLGYEQSFHPDSDPIFIFCTNQHFFRVVVYAMKHLLPTWLLSMSMHLQCVCKYLCPTISVIVSSFLIKVTVLPYTQSKTSAGHRITYYTIRSHDIKKLCLHEMHIFFITHFLTSTVCRWWLCNCRMQPVEALKGRYLTFCMCATMLTPFDVIIFVWCILCV